MRATSQMQTDVKCLPLFTGEGLQDMEKGHRELIRQEGKVVNDGQPHTYTQLMGRILDLQSWQTNIPYRRFSCLYHTHAH